MRAALYERDHLLPFLQRAKSMVELDADDREFAEFFRGRATAGRLPPLSVEAVRERVRSGLADFEAVPPTDAFAAFLLLSCAEPRVLKDLVRARERARAQSLHSRCTRKHSPHLLSPSSPYPPPF